MEKSIRHGSPYYHTAIAQFLRRRIAELASKKSQREIATEVGYDKPNMVSMIKNGESRLPFEKIPAFARSLEVDLAYLFRLSLEQHWPDFYKSISAAGIEILTEEERKTIFRLREDNNKSAPPDC
jgi:transcriptional regulator with XRE-family HTH domain